MRRTLNESELAQVIQVVETNAGGFCPSIAKEIAKLPWVARCHYKLSVRFLAEYGERRLLQRYLVLRHDRSWDAAEKVLEDLPPEPDAQRN